jgi:hypothetical protein
MGLIISVLLSLFGPLVGELIKRLFMKWFPQLPRAERKAARKEFMAIGKRAYRKHGKGTDCSYAAVCSANDVQSELEAFEARMAARVEELKVQATA